MTATTQALPRRLPTIRVPLAATKLLRIELRRSPMPWILPVVAALFWFDTYRPSTSQPPLWMLRTFWNMGEGHTIIDFGPFVAGMAAWIGARDSRRGMADLVTTTARPRWTAQLTTWAAGAIWAVGAYLAFVAVLFGVYAAQGVTGAPPWWWVAVGATAVAMFTAAGFAIGTLVRSRYAAPIAAFASMLALILSSQTGFTHPTGWALVLPTNSNGNYQPMSGTFYRYLPDLPIARILFLAGIAAAVLGLIGAAGPAGGRRVRTIAATVTICGLAAGGTAVVLATTARLAADGMVIPALHDAADDRPIAYTPVCAPAGAVPVCVNPAYSRYLPDMIAAVQPALTVMAGLPGAPVRVVQVAGNYQNRQGSDGQSADIAGNPPVLELPLAAEGLPGAFGWTAAELDGELRLLAIHAFVGAGDTAGTPAQQAIEIALLNSGGIAFADQADALNNDAPRSWSRDAGVKADPGIDSAAHRFAALTATARNAWLAANLPALRAGTITLTDLP